MTPWYCFGRQHISPLRFFLVENSSAAFRGDVRISIWESFFCGSRREIGSEVARIFFFGISIGHEGGRRGARATADRGQYGSVMVRGCAV